MALAFIICSHAIILLVRFCSLIPSREALYAVNRHGSVVSHGGRHIINYYTVRVFKIYFRLLVGSSKQTELQLAIETPFSFMPQWYTFDMLLSRHWTEGKCIDAFCCNVCRVWSLVSYIDLTIQLFIINFMTYFHLETMRMSHVSLLSCRPLLFHLVIWPKYTWPCLLIMLPYIVFGWYDS